MISIPAKAKNTRFERKQEKHLALMPIQRHFLYGCTNNRNCHTPTIVSVAGVTQCFSNPSDPKKKFANAPVTKPEATHRMANM